MIDRNTKIVFGDADITIFCGVDNDSENGIMLLDNAVAEEGHSVGDIISLTEEAKKEYLEKEHSVEIIF